MNIEALKNAGMKNSDAEIGKRLKDARIRAGFKTQAEFADTFNIPRPTYNVHESGKRSLDYKVAKDYAEKLNVSANWLLYGQEPSAIKIVSEREIEQIEGEFEALNVVGAVEAGVWSEAVEWPEDDWKVEMALKDNRYPGARKFALEVRGESMNLIYQPGDILRCVYMQDIGDIIEDGKRYIVYRKNAAGEIEATVKELRIMEDGTKWLWPRSTHPKHQQPIELNVNEGDEIILHARVIGRSSDE